MVSRSYSHSTLLPTRREVSGDRRVSFRAVDQPSSPASRSIEDKIAGREKSRALVTTPLHVSRTNPHRRHRTASIIKTIISNADIHARIPSTLSNPLPPPPNHRVPPSIHTRRIHPTPRSDTILLPTIIARRHHRSRRIRMVGMSGPSCRGRETIDLPYWRIQTSFLSEKRVPTVRGRTVGIPTSDR